MTWIAAHRKLLVAVAGAAVTVADATAWSANPYVISVVAVLTAAGVYQVPNKPKPV